jgi:hypothetical protein
MRVVNFDDGFTSETAPISVGVDASNVAVTPAGNLASVDAQAALTELQGDIDTINAALTPHLADTSTHGVTGDIVGTTDSQALTNKTIVAASNTITTAASGNLTATELNTALAELQADIDGRATPADVAVVQSDIDTHESDTANPHAVTATQVGLGNVDNTSDATKNAAVATLTNKTLTSPVINTPTGIVKGDVGLGNVDNTSDATKNAAAVTLTNKTLTAPLISEGAAPSTPASGNVAVYAKTDKKLYTKDSSGTETQVGAGGTGELNMVANPSDANNWSRTGTTGAAGNAPATTTTAGDLPLSGVSSTAIKLLSATSAAAEATAYVSYSFTTPASVSGKQKVEFYMRPGSNFAESEWTVSVYQSTTRQNLSTDVSSVTYLPNLSGRFVTYVDLDASTAYTLRFARTVNAGTNAAQLNLANVVVGPGLRGGSAAVGEWQAFTPAFTATGGGTVTTGSSGTPVSSGFYRRNGSSMDVNVVWRWGTSSPTFGTSGDYVFTVPAGLSVNASALGTSGNSATAVLGSGYFYDNSASDTFPISATYYATANQIKLALTTNLSGASLGTTAPVTIAVDDQISFSISIPISEWAGSGTVNVGQNDVDYSSNSTTSSSDDTTAFAYGPSGSVVPSITATTGTTSVAKRVRFPTPISPTDRIQLEVQNSGTGPWIPVEESYYYTGSIRIGGTIYGMGWVAVASSSTDIDVLFNKGGRLASNGTIAGAGSDYPNNAADRWRVRKASGGQAVGFGAATATSSGLVSTTTQSLAGVKTFNDGIKLDDAAGQTTLAYYAEADHTTDINNLRVAAPNVTIKCTRVGRMVTLQMTTSLSATTKDATTTAPSCATALPTAYRPTNTFNFPLLIRDNGTNQIGNGAVLNTGIITFDRGDLGNWTSGGSANIYRWVVSYQVD